MTYDVERVAGAIYEATAQIAWNDDASGLLTTNAVRFKILARAALSALPRQTLQDGWQTMETAPKDGTDIFLALPAWGDGPEITFAVGGFRDGEWFTAPDEPEALHDPTHWRPLPAPPQQDKP